MGLSNHLSCEAGSFCCRLNTHGVFSQRFEALFPRAGALGCAVCFAPPPFLPVYLCVKVGLQGLPATTFWGLPTAAWPAPFHNLPPPPLPCCESSPPQLPISAPPTCLDECFLFISLVVRLPYSSIFCQFWLFFVFKLLSSFFWLCEEAQCVYLCLHLGRKSSSYLLTHTRRVSQADTDRKLRDCLSPRGASSLAPLIRWSDLRCFLIYILRVNIMSKPVFRNLKNLELTAVRGEGRAGTG